jgi:hypothetical protein
VAADWTNAVRGTHLLWLPIPAYSALPILLAVMHARVWTFTLAFTTCIVLSVLRAKGIKVPWLVRRFKQRQRGGRIHARSLWFRRRMQCLTSFDTVPLRDK